MLDLPSPSKGQLKALRQWQKCGVLVWVALSSQQPDKQPMGYSGVLFSLPSLWVPQGVLSPSTWNENFVRGPGCKYHWDGIMWDPCIRSGKVQTRCRTRWSWTTWCKLVSLAGVSFNSKFSCLSRKLNCSFSITAGFRSPNPCGR